MIDIRHEIEKQLKEILKSRWDISEQHIDGIYFPGKNYRAKA